LVPDCGSTYFLPRCVGDMRPRALAILAEKIDADEAQRIGIVWKVYPDDAFCRRK
jgi:2-(1,2-epoxy-1,2-dihydrophenyl)acetyl-CoA isomerase